MADPWTQRQLCDDGSCIGVIRSDGRCGTCGRAARNWGDERRRGLLDEDEADRQTEEDVARREPAAAPDDFGRRRLCPDGACVGVLDAKGVCGVCGAEGTATDPAADPAADAGNETDSEAGSDVESNPDPESPAENDEDEDEDEDEDGDEDSDDPDDDDDDRRLCPDGGCVGLIGADGRCKVCGRKGDR